MNEELDSQLSAMFDDELAPAECELLARRLSRDEHLKARWGRYAIMGAVIRAERGVRLNAPLAGRVNAVLLAEPALAAHTAPRDRSAARLRWWQPLAAHLTPPPVSLAPAAATQGESYVVPVPKPPTVVVPSTELANYVVAHSMFSTPVARRNLLSAFMTSEPAAAGAEEPQGDVKRIAQ